MSLHSYQVKVCLEDCETTVVTLMSPVILDHIQITWFFQYINDKWFEQMEDKTFQPSIDMLCDQLNQTFPGFSFTTNDYDTEWCDNQPRISCIPPALTNTQYSFLTRLCNQIPALQGFRITTYAILYYPVKNQTDTYTKYSIRHGISLLWKSHKEDILQYLKNHPSEKSYFFEILDVFQLIYFKDKAKEETS